MTATASADTLRSMRSWLLIVRFRSRAGLRAWRENAFVFAVLAPIVLGALVLVADRYLPLARERLASSLAATGAGAVGLLGVALAVILVALGVSRATEELFPGRIPTALLDPLPVPEGARFWAGWSVVLLGNGTAWGTLVAVLWLLGRGSEGTPPSITTFLAGAAGLALAFLPLASLQLLAAQLAVRSRLVRFGAAGLVGVVLAFAVILATRHPAFGFVAAPLAPSAWWLERGMTLALGLPVEAGTATRRALELLVASTVLAASSWGLSLRYRRRDLAAARALRTRQRSRAARFAARVVSVLPSPVRAQVVRDLLLVWRRFSPVVYVSAGLALACVGLIVNVVPGLAVEPYWRGRLGLVVAAFGVLACAALVPFLLRYEWPRFGFERAAGLAPTDVWKAKVWTARLLGLPGVVAGAIALLAVVPPGRAWWLASGELLLAGWVVASLIGVSTFEIVDRPMLGLVFGALLALAWAALMILYPGLLPFWLVGYVLVSGLIADRATHRVRFLDVIR